MTLREFFTYSERLGFRRRWAATILGLNLCSILFEGIGIGMFLPVLEYMNSDGDVAKLTAESRLWQGLTELFSVFSMPVNLASLLAVAFLALICRQAFTYSRLVYSARVQCDFIRGVRDEGFQRFLKAKLGYHDHIRAGDFVNEITTELVTAMSCLGSAITFVGFILLCLVYVGILFALSPIMTAAALAIILFAALCLRGVHNRTQPVGKALMEANQRMSSFLVERLKSIRLVRLSNMEEAETTEMRGLTKVQRDQQVSLLSLKALLSVSIEPIVVAAGFVLLYFAVTTFELNFERILLFFLICFRLLPVIKETMLTRQSCVGSLASLEIVDRRLLELEAARDTEGGRRRFFGLERGISFENVSFEYAGKGSRVPALRNISLDIPAGKMTALVGPSGAGKSTLIDLLPRLREAQSGQILLDGVPHTEFEIASLRAGIAYAPQAPQIFNVSVAEHIRYGQPNATMEDIREAARLTGAEEFIENLPEGYNMLLGEGGLRLSGGEKQRLDLARAMVRQAPVLILDEPTSNLDAQSEKLFRRALRRIRQETGITVILIGHRLSTVRDADLIVVLNAGRVDDVGSHEELMKRGGWYAGAVAVQKGEGVLDAVP